MNRFIASYEEEKQLTPISGFWAFPLVPLEKSLESVAPSIPELKQSIKDAKKHCYYPSKHNLTRDESAAVLLYTMEAGEHSFYRVLNGILRKENRRLVTPWFSFLKLFNTALNKLPTVKGCIWRGIAGDFSESYKQNEVITWWNFSSCSSDVDVVESFLENENKSTVFMIEARNGKNLEGHTQFSNESEILLPMGTKLRVKGKRMKHGQLNLIHLVEISEDEEEEEEEDNKLSASMGAVCVTPKPPKKPLTSKPLVPIHSSNID
jgi:hypothetical protein